MMTWPTRGTQVGSTWSMVEMPPTERSPLWAAPWLYAAPRATQVVAATWAFGMTRNASSGTQPRGL